MPNPGLGRIARHEAFSKIGRDDFEDQFHLLEDYYAPIFVVDMRDDDGIMNE